MAKSPIKLRGFNWKRGAIYIRVNRHLTSPLSKGVEPGMGSKGLKHKAGYENKQWFFPRGNPT